MQGVKSSESFILLPKTKIAMPRNINVDNRPDEAEQSGPALPSISVAERGRNADGEPITFDRRLFMQFMAFGGCADPESLRRSLAQINPQAVVYQDMNDPQGIGLLSFSESPGTIMDTVHTLRVDALAKLRPKSEFTMLGRTYSIGYESDLEDVLINRPVKRVCDQDLSWCVWYPVRRSGMFERESSEEQRKMLMEHGGIGHAFGKAGLATDIRLAAHGLNQEDNDFIVGLLGRELYPLSALVQRMRRTRQTSEFIQNMGPFFIGRVLWQPEMDRGLH